LRILEALAAENGSALLDEVERLAERAPDFGAVLDELMSALQQIAVIQLVGDRLPDEELEALKPLAERISPEDVQLYFQIALNGRRDLPVGREPRVGLEMTLLRMLAFRPVASEAGGAVPGDSGVSRGGAGPERAPARAGTYAPSASPVGNVPSAPSSRNAPSTPPVDSGEAIPRRSGATAVRERLAEQLERGAKPASTAAPENVAASQTLPKASARSRAPQHAAPSARVSAEALPRPRASGAASHPAADGAASAVDGSQPRGARAFEHHAAPTDDDGPPPAPPELFDAAPSDADGDGAAPIGPDFASEGMDEGAVAGRSRGWDGRWATLIQAADIRGAARQLADHCELAKATDRRLDLVLVPEKETLATQQVRSRLEAAIGQHLGRPITLSIVTGKPPRPTPAELRLANENERMRKAREAMEQDPNVKAAQEAFGAVLEADTIQPRNGD
jgi:DNA polymerase-3 subunit gamma/tau